MAFNSIPLLLITISSLREAFLSPFAYFNTTVASNDSIALL